MPKKTGEIEHYFTSKPGSRLEFRQIHTSLRGRTFQFLTATGVFSKKHIDLGTKVLIEHMILPEKGYVLDVGCGYGAIGIVAAAVNPNLYVVMVDINERAVRLVKRNIKINGVSNAEVRRGNLYEPVREMTFDCILSNPPISAGLSTVETIVTEAPKHMREGAILQMVVKSKIGRERLRQTFEKVFGNFTILARKSGYRVLMAEKR
ncbi:MAG: class I SAM-dependent methyltransferase [Candidatus Bathyarchaeia archaeon]|nr:class I SAM-dependent methyltransferase [Candidatus Bathyarchaeota archaeon]